MAQVNATVGDLTGNADKIVEWTRRAGQQGAQVVVFPEMMLTGYPVEDLALRGSFVNASQVAVREVAERLAGDGLGGQLGVDPVDDGLLGHPADPEGHTLIGLIPGERVVLRAAGGELASQGGVAAIEQLQRGLVLQAWRWPRVWLAAQPHALDLVQVHLPHMALQVSHGPPGAAGDIRTEIRAFGHVAEPPEIGLKAISQSLALHAVSVAHTPDNPRAARAAGQREPRRRQALPWHGDRDGCRRRAHPSA